MTKKKLCTVIYIVYHFDKHLNTTFKVGYPNVGKSTTINALLEHKKVAVSATPGKTKHFQVNLLLIFIA